MKGIAWWGGVVLIGSALGFLSVFIPPSRHDVPPPGLTETTRKEQLKELERLRLQGIREAADGEHEKGIETFLRLQYVNPHDPFAAQRMAAMMEEMGEEAFVPLFDTAMQGRPDKENRDRTLAAVYFQAGEDQKSKALAETYLAVHPDDIASLYLVGAVARQAGDNEKAVAILTRVIENQPGHYYAYLELQNAYDALGDAREANRMLGLALENSPAKRDGICCGLPPDPKAAQKPVDKGA